MKIINALSNLMKKWTTRVVIRGDGVNVTSEIIRYLRGIFQGDSLSVILFVLCVNPLSFLLNMLNGYRMGPNGQRDQNITNLFFVDDLKLW